jgi:cadmium resistance protein CadD (predicted permease)
MTTDQRRGIGAFLTSRAGIAAVVFLAIALFFLWQEHAAHVLGYLPLILFLGVCVGMHFFMHGSHGGGGSGHAGHGGGKARK